MELLQVENLTFAYPDAERSALTDVTFTLREGDFAVLLGPSGCGKSTLLRLLKRETSPFGAISGHACFCGTPVTETDARISAMQVGFLEQNPENGIVTDTVWHELAFTMENLGYPTGEIRKRVAELASYFGIEGWFRKRTEELSGGQKQLLNLAAVMATEPKLLLLDEPTAQLDPIAAGDFLAMLDRIHRELGVTILLAEHRTEDILSLCNRVLVLREGKLRYDGSAEGLQSLAGTRQPNGLRETGEDTVTAADELWATMPAAARIWRLMGGTGAMPLSVTEGRRFLAERFVEKTLTVEQRKEGEASKRPVAAEIKDAYFRYERRGKDVLRGTGLKVYEGEHLCLLGGNGSGKTTTLSVLAGILTPYAGTVLLFGRKLTSLRRSEFFRNGVAMLPQNPKDAFVCDVVREDWELACQAAGIPSGERAERIRETAEMLGISELTERHPYDMSGGEQQRAALGKVLLLQPKLLLLDEPTKGLDASGRRRLAQLLGRLRESGMTIVTVTHDMEFAAETAKRVGLFFDGEVVTVMNTHDFFAENAFYTTPASRISRGFVSKAITVSEVAAAGGRRE